MTIQSLINQAINTGTVAAGLYAHSPTGQRKAQIKNLTSDYERIVQAQDLVHEPMTANEIEIDEEISKRRSLVASKLFEMTGKPEHYEEYRQALEADPTRQEAHQRAQQKAQQRAEERAKTLKEQNQAKQLMNQLINTYGGF